jgi:hypothetical protein
MPAHEMLPEEKLPPWLLSDGKAAHREAELGERSSMHV